MTGDAVAMLPLPGLIAVVGCAVAASSPDARWHGLDVAVTRRWIDACVRTVSRSVGLCLISRTASDLRPTPPAGS